MDSGITRQASHRTRREWDALVSRYRPRVEAGESDGEYYAASESVLAELNDPHTGVTPPLVGNAGCFFASTQEMEGQAVVAQVGGSALGRGAT